jgi:cell filamentation protein
VSNPYADSSGVFRNKPGFTDYSQLKQFEYEATANRAKEIQDGNADLHAGGHGLERLSAIHKHLFQDVYEWAGKTRTVSLKKRAENGMVSVFGNPDTIVTDWKALEEKTQAFASGKGLSLAQKHEALANIFIEANRIHPFIEGNGRSLQVFMKELAREQSIELDYTKVDPSEWNRASAISGTHGRLFEYMHLIPSQPDHGPIKKLFSDMACPVHEASHHDLDKNPATLHDDATKRLKHMAECFKASPEEAVKKHPELGAAAAVMAAIEKKAEADGLNAQQRAVVMARARDNMAAQIERGDVPSVQIRKEKQIKTEQQHDLER